MAAVSSFIDTFARTSALPIKSKCFGLVGGGGGALLCLSVFLLSNMIYLIIADVKQALLWKVLEDYH